MVSLICRFKPRKAAWGHDNVEDIFIHVHDERESMCCQFDIES